MDILTLDDKVQLRLQEFEQANRDTMEVIEALTRHPVVGDFTKFALSIGDELGDIVSLDLLYCIASPRAFRLFIAEVIERVVHKKNPICFLDIDLAPRICFTQAGTVGLDARHLQDDQSVRGERELQYLWEKRTVFHSNCTTYLTDLNKFVQAAERYLGNTDDDWTPKGTYRRGEHERTSRYDR